MSDATIDLVDALAEIVWVRELLPLRPGERARLGLAVDAIRREARAAARGVEEAPRADTCRCEGCVPPEAPSAHDSPPPGVVVAAKLRPPKPPTPAEVREACARECEAVGSEAGFIASDTAADCAHRIRALRLAGEEP